MKVRDTAMGKWFEQLSPDESVQYVCECLRINNSPDNVFWAVVEHYELTAATPTALAAQVVEHLMEFELDLMEGNV